MKTLLDEMKTTVLGEIKSLRLEMDLYKQQMDMLMKDRAHPTLPWNSQYSTTASSSQRPLTESWLKPYVHDAQISIEDYNIHRCDRSTRVGGGVILYTHCDLPITNTEKLDQDSCQLLVCTSEPSEMNIGAFQDDYLCDFNFPDFTWDPPLARPPSSSTHLLEKFMNNHLFSQYILQPTRQGNTLDLFLTNSASLVTHVLVKPTRMSDHDLIEIYLSYNPCQPNVNAPPVFDPASFRGLDFTKADFSSISSKVEAVDWHDVLESNGIDCFPETFRDMLLSICQEHCPPKLPPKRQRSHILRRLSHKKRRLQDRLEGATVDPSTPSELIQRLNNEIALVHYDIRDAIVNERHFREEVAVGKVKSNPKYFYSYAKRFSRQKQTISMLFDESNNICTDPQLIANILQTQFKSVFSDPRDVDIAAADFTPPTITERFEDSQLLFSEGDVISAIDDMKADSAPGPDGIPSVLLKSCKHALARPIFILWSQSYESGVVPSFYKNSLLHHFENILENFLEGNDTDYIYLDYAKAFDKVDYALLIKKLSKYGIHPKIVKWIESFLKDRTQQVAVEGQFSVAALILSGVPQGTILGPILFLIFINDITLCVGNSVVRCFADDTRIMRAISTTPDMVLLQQDLNTVT
ncbi:uncharacterized protein [Palaemon carinicauda]|uniref:uncharacterized protein n=1 Tax=Palaemon carinicauda TaxID=392227 RepID=UPI0035B5E196